MQPLGRFRDNEPTKRKFIVLVRETLRPIRVYELSFGSCKAS